MLAAVIALLFVSAQACEYKGATYRHGDTWIVSSPNSESQWRSHNSRATHSPVASSSWVMQCEMPSHNEWRTYLAGCVTPRGSQILVGQRLEEDGFSFECIKEGDGMLQLKSHRRQ
uniref:Abnormal cell migration protein 18-like fibronectin type I domain-containing protein n=1 Tax=Plectus sambesii TaxID=2011161 RepID=A0A914UQG9_9BILA